MDLTSIHRLKKSCVVAYDAMALLTIAVFTIVIAPSVAYAYVDPSVMTYTIQALAGVAVALSAVLGVALRRTRKVLLRVLNIDENAGKEVDPPWGRKTNGRGSSEPTHHSSSHCGDVASDEFTSSRTCEEKPNLTWKQKLPLSFVVLLFCGFTLGIAAPLEIVAGSAGSLLFGVSDVWYVMAVPVILAVLVLSCLLALVRDKVFDLLLLLLFCGGLCCYIQAMVLNVGLPSADGSAVEWADHITMMVISTIVWAVVLLSPLFLRKFNRRRTQAVVSFVSAGLIAVQAVGVVSLFFSEDDTKALEGDIEVTEEGLFEVSGESNVIVFVLDCFDTVMLDDILQDKPDLLDQFTGFTYYRNNVGMMVPTMYAVPYLMTGEEPQHGEALSTYLSQRYQRSSFIEDMNASGYSVGMYSDAFGFEYLANDELKREVSDHTVNVHPLESFSIDKIDTFRVLLKCALYRDMPWVLKWRFWFYTDEVNQRVVEQDSDGNPENTVYMIDDPSYFEKLKSRGLSIQDGDYKGAFRFIHLNGPHRPFIMNEEGIEVGLDNVTRSQQAIGSLYVVSTYLEELRSLGLYDEATIIITSDHGDWESSTELPNFAISPILLFKPSATAEESALPVQYSSVPTSHADLRATILDAMGASSDRYGQAIEDLTNENRMRITYMVTSDGSHAIDILEYEVDGDVLDFSTWNYTGVSWPVEE